MHVPRRGPQPACQATLSLRYSASALRPPRHRKREGLPTVARWVVLVREVEPPATGEPIEWLLLTTVAVEASMTPSNASNGTRVAGASRSGIGF